ncbi:MAG: copper amine oxidase N-terminal domain-containing protein [Bacillota bacterium]|nr:copper amine oxidase N-terminal domain-containing protein [Bacillota bacterium]
MVNRNRSWRWLSALLALALFLAVLPAGVAAAPRSLSPAERVRVERAIQFLRDMGDDGWADNVETWLEGARIEADDSLSANATTNRGGTIVIRGDLLGALTDAELADQVKAFEKDSWLARLLVHEKTHAHQAPEGGAMDNGPSRTGEDWDASGDVFAECKGPEATEVEAYYQLILALLRWCKVVQETALPKDLSEAEMQEALRVKTGKVAWLLDQAAYWAERLQDLGYEKADSGGSLREKLDALEAGLMSGIPAATEHEIKLAKMELIEEALEAMFGEGGEFARVRETYQEKQGEEAVSIDVGAQGASVTFPDGWGQACFPPFAAPVTFTVYKFAQPPDPLPEHEYLSGPYDIAVSGLEGGLPDFTLTFSSLSLAEYPQAKVYYFAPVKAELEAGQTAPPLWAPLDTTDVSDGAVKALAAETRYATMHAVMAPIGSRIPKTVRMWIGAGSYISNDVPKTSDLAPFIESDRTFVAVRFLAEEFGATADWFPKDAPVEVVTLSRPDRTITIRIGSHDLTVARPGQTASVTSDVAAQIRNGRTVLPFRVIAEAFGAEVDWGPKGAAVEWVSFEW